MFFCIDTGAEVTVISEKAHAKIGSPELKTLDTCKTLKGPSGDQLVCKWHFISCLQKGDLTIKEEIYVIKNRHKLLLGRPTIRGLNLLKRLRLSKSDRFLNSFLPYLKVLVSLRESIQLSCRIMRCCSL